MTYAKRVDSTHKAVAGALRRLGWTVLDLSRCGSDVPDLLAAHVDGRVVLIECKAAKGRLTQGRRRVLEAWPGETAVLRSLDDVVALTKGA